MVRLGVVDGLHHYPGPCVGQRMIHGERLGSMWRPSARSRRAIEIDEWPGV